MNKSILVLHHFIDFYGLYRWRCGTQRKILAKTFHQVFYIFYERRIQWLFSLGFLPFFFRVLIRQSIFIMTWSDPRKVSFAFWEISSPTSLQPLEYYHLYFHSQTKKKPLSNIKKVGPYQMICIIFYVLPKENFIYLA